MRFVRRQDDSCKDNTIITWFVHLPFESAISSYPKALGYTLIGLEGVLGST
jgi:hypothetical protein